MIGPVYGRDKSQPNGILQFINKQGENMVVTPDDRVRFNEIAEVIGMAIERTKELTGTIGVTLKFHSVMEKISNIMASETHAADVGDGEKSTMDLLKEIGKNMKEIKDISNKMVENRNRMI